jgi:hypothetical protein
VFQVPKNLSDDLFGAKQPGQLALIDLYLPLGRRENEVNGMFAVRKPPTRNLVIVPVHSLRCTAHLFPRFGERKVDRELTTLTVLDAYDEFFLNNRVDKDAYRTIYWDVGDEED